MSGLYRPGYIGMYYAWSASLVSLCSMQCQKKFSIAVQFLINSLFISHSCFGSTKLSPQERIQARLVSNHLLGVTYTLFDGIV